MVDQRNAYRLSRRECLRFGCGAAFAGVSGTPFLALADETPKQQLTPKAVAAVVTIYTHNLHADVLLTKILEGWKHDGGPSPALKLASVYIDQLDVSEFGKDLCKKHGVPIFDTIEKSGHGRRKVDPRRWCAEYRRTWELRGV